LIGSFAVPFVAKTLPQKDFDPISEFVPVVGLTHAPMNILVPAKSPVKDVAGLVALSKANNGLKGGTAHPSANASMHILDKTIGTNTQQINYKQITQLYTDLSSGILDYAFGGATSSAAALVQSGHLRSLGRLDQTGVPDFSWTALFVKAGNENGKVAQAAKKVVTAENMAALPQPFFKADAATLRSQLLREYALIPIP
jgi:tripartite-type tricarboxylate transporter receptor subunit TctC